MTNLGPLTTVFTPSGSDCASVFIGLVQETYGVNMWVQYGVGGAASSACLPPNFKPFESYYYSPGICPSGYTPGCTAQAFPTGTETASDITATCCPTAYSCRDNRGDDPFGCWSSFSGPKTFAVSTYSFEKDSAGLTTRVYAGTTTETWSNNYIRAYGPIVRYAPDDFQTSSSTIPTPTQSSSGSITPTTPTTPTTPITTETGSSSLSTGAAAGIGIGCGVGAIALFGIVAIIFMRRRRQRVQSEASTQPAYEADKLQQDYQPQPSYPYELSGEQESRPHELNVERE
ncbi:hypothetical protein F5Y06DRAFT_291983 [Hypoxylon sp. FL0890]|nr:hypothetical protein F5Y06DRAFT_291983 [Hypoxylon sp. FL0890]